MRMQIPRVLCLRHAVVFPLYIIFKCTLAIWLSPLTVEISNEPYINEVVRLSPRKLETAIWLRSVTVEISDEPCTNEVGSLSPRKLETA